MNNKNKPAPRASNVARGMILAGTGRKQVFRDKRNRRPKDARRVREQYDAG